MLDLFYIFQVQFSVFAKEDLKAAKALLDIELFSSAAYHCQQASEKALKAFLAFKKHEILKTHDLIKLVLLCSKYDKKFEKLYDDAEELTPFATKFRYPTEFDIPDYADAKEAVDQARRILRFVRRKINEPKSGQMSLLK